MRLQQIMQGTICPNETPVDNEGYPLTQQLLKFIKLICNLDNSSCLIKATFNVVNITTLYKFLKCLFLFDLNNQYPFGASSMSIRKFQTMFVYFCHLLLIFNYEHSICMIWNVSRIRKLLISLGNLEWIQNYAIDDLIVENLIGFGLKNKLLKLQYKK